MSDRELEQLDALLADSHIGATMRVEELDGFFSGLVAGPPVLKPCQFWPVILGKAVGDPGTLDYIRASATLLPLLARHWHTIIQNFDLNEFHLPLLVGDESGMARGRDWARGFLRAVGLHAEAWSALIGSDEGGAAVLPMMILAHEDDPDPLLRPPPMDAAERAAILRLMIVGVIRAHRHFASAKIAVGTDAIPSNFH